MENAVWVWLGIGVVLIVSEFALPGLVAIFLGIGALLTGGLVFLGYLETIPYQLFFWLLSSTILLFTLREQFRKFFPSLSSFERTDEDEVMIGKVVEVVEDIAPDGAPGRVRYQGTTWEAFSQSRIEKGQFVKIVERKNLTLIVEPVENP